MMRAALIIVLAVVSMNLADITVGIGLAKWILVWLIVLPLALKLWARIS